ncbi:MAG: T9SS type A sorting domain-containing protein [Bacteroidetes bacterium]|nr:T9SS type A sorting domain-containing protein [Bacteroidota bacterium]
MKPYRIIFLLLFPCMAFGYTWTAFGPEGIKTNDVCFNAGSGGYMVICRANGICVSDITGSSWTTYTYGGLPVWEAIPFDSASILLVMGDGSFSDGIYKFNFTTQQFTGMELVASPTFIRFCATNQTYYAGTKYNGLMTSPNGSDWSYVPFFSSQQVTSMDFRDNHFVLTTGFQFQCIYNSSDSGKTWNHTTGNGNFMTYLAFHPNGKLYGIIPMSNSASLRSSADFGQNWDVCAWTDDVNTVGFDAIGNVLVGFRTHGIARYDTLISSLTYYNEGLPDQSVNRIRINPMFSSITLFCCTDNGAYFSNDYLSALPGNAFNDEAVSVKSFPNPCTSMAEIEFFLPEYRGNSAMLSIYNYSGELLSMESYSISPLNENRISLNVNRFPAGIYFYRLNAGKYVAIRKLAVVK